MTTLSLVVLGNPLSQNAAYHIVTIGKGPKAHSTLAMTPEGKAYKAEIQRIVRAARPAEWDTSAQVDVELTYWFGSLRGDCDGPGKLSLDSLQCSRVPKEKQLPPAVANRIAELTNDGKQRDDGLILNDSQVRDFTQRKRLDRERPRLELTVRVVATESKSVVKRLAVQGVLAAGGGQ